MPTERIVYKSLLIKAPQRIYGGLIELKDYDKIIEAIDNIKSQRSYVINKDLINAFLLEIEYITTVANVVTGIIIPVGLTRFLGNMPIIYGNGSKSFTKEITPINIAAAKIYANAQCNTANDYADPAILKLFS